MGIKDPSLWPVVLLAIVVVASDIASLQWRKEIKELQQRGTRIMATVIAVEERTSCNTGVEVYPTFTDTSYAGGTLGAAESPGGITFCHPCAPDPVAAVLTQVYVGRRASRRQAHRR